MSGRLVEHDLSADTFLDQQEALVAFDDCRDGDVYALRHEEERESRYGGSGL
jgi:hypothetical protein